MKKDPEQGGRKSRLAAVNGNTLGILICVLVAVLALAVFLLSRGGDTESKTEAASSQTESAETKPDEDRENAPSAVDYSKIGDSNLESVTTDSKSDEKPWTELSDDEYAIVISAVQDGWDGEYMEDGSDEKVKNILALEFTNTGSQDIQYAEYVFEINGDPVSFRLSDLPAGQSCITLETSRHEYNKKETLTLISRVVAAVDEIPFARDEVLVVDNGDSSITIMNLTQEELPVVRVFYKSYDKKEGLFIGGITYTAKVENVPAGGGITVTPAHYDSDASMVVGSSVYESDS